MAVVFAAAAAVASAAALRGAGSHGPGKTGQASGGFALPAAARFPGRAAVEAADRGIHAHEGAQTWNAICRQIEADFKRGEFRLGALAGIDLIARALRQHFPRAGGDADELPNQPALL